MRSARAFVAAAVACSACSASTPPAAPPTVEIAPPPAPVNTRFRGYMTIDMVPLTDRDLGSEKDALIAEAHEQMPEILACMRTLPPKELDVWVAGRVGEDGRFGDLTVASDVPKEIAKCATAKLSTLHVASFDPIAMSVVLHAEPAPDDCKGDDCKVISVPTGEVTDDGPMGGVLGSTVETDDQRREALEAARSASILGATGTITGDSFGVGGLGLSGIDGGGDGIGLGSIGTIGHGAGLGNGGSQPRATQRKKPPSVRMGATNVSGRLPPEVIQRIVRQNFGRFRLCYEKGLATDATLAGTVRVSFTIKNDGSIGQIVDDKSDLPDAKTVACVVSAFGALSFPAPEGGIVKVTYPIIFAPPVDPPTLTIGGARFAAVDGAKVADKLKGAGWKTVVVAASKPGERFVVFAVKADASTNPMERPQGFLTSIHLATNERTGFFSQSIESEGVRFVAEGDEPTALLQDIVDPQPEKPSK